MDRIRVLIVDDTKETIDLVKKVLQIEQDKFEIVGEASHGEEALELIPILEPDIVLMDINMPVMNGLEATEKISIEHPQVAVIIMSVQGETEYLRKAMLCGAKEYIVKPFNYNTLLETIVVTYTKNMEELQQLNAAQQVAAGEDIEIDTHKQDEDLDFLNMTEEESQQPMVSELKINKGFRAVTVGLIEGLGTSGILREGLYVDVILFLKYDLESKVAIKHSIAKMILQNAKVLSVEKRFTDVFVTLAVPTEEVEKLVLAENIGKVKLVIRPEQDQNKASTKLVTWKDLIEKLDLAQS